MSKVNILQFATAIGKLGAFLNFVPSSSTHDIYFIMKLDRAGNHELFFNLPNQKVFYSYKEHYDLPQEKLALFRYIIAELGFDLEICSISKADQLVDELLKQTGQAEQEHDTAL